MYFSVRGFRINEPEFPLVAIVFPDYQSFARYAQADQGPGPGGQRDPVHPARRRAEAGLPEVALDGGRVLDRRRNLGR